MQNNNDTSPDALMGYMVMSVVVCAVVVLLYLAAVLCVALTLVCIWAWNEERHLFGYTITTAEARGFVICGVVAAVVLSGLGLILALNRIGNYEQISFFVAIGYILGSLGFASWCAHEAEKREQETAQRQQLNAMQRPAPVQRETLPTSHEIFERFEYASWDDDATRAPSDRNH